MNLRPLGKSGIKITPLILGTWAIGGWMWGGSDEQQAISAIRTALDSGINCIDTAAIYAQGYSEELVGKAIRDIPRDRVVLAYSPLERGLLTGTVTPDRTFPIGDHRSKHKLFDAQTRKKVLASLEKIRPIADKHGKSFAQISINWTIRQPGLTAAIVGARNPQQASHNAAAMTFELTEEELRQVSAAFE
ncbi:MAG: aldo/keto reductase [Phycisphaerae bacterium]